MVFADVEITIRFFKDPMDKLKAGRKNVSNDQITQKRQEEKEKKKVSAIKRISQRAANKI